MWRAAWSVFDGQDSTPLTACARVTLAGICASALCPRFPYESDLRRVVKKTGVSGAKINVRSDGPEFLSESLIAVSRSHGCAVAQLGKGTAYDE